MKLMFIGPPGAGKGTQAKKTCEKYDLPHISTGDMLRAEIEKGSELGLEAKDKIDHGQLVDDDVIIGMVIKRLSEKDCKDGFAFDGFPRTLAQAKALDKIVALDVCININVPSSFLVERALKRHVCKECNIIHSHGGKCDHCGGELIKRSDDTEETVLSRLKIYENQTKPLLGFYREKDILLEIDGTGNIDKVAKEIYIVLDRLLAG